MPKLTRVSIFLALTATWAQAAGADSEPDPFSAVYAHRLEFADDGSPLVSVRIDEGEDEIVLVLHGASTLRTKAGEVHDFPKGARLHFRVVDGSPARIRFLPQVGEFRMQERKELTAAIETWRTRGFDVGTRLYGASFAVRGTQVDSRRYGLTLGAFERKEEAEDFVAKLRALGESASVVEEVVLRPRGRVEVRDARGKLVASSEEAIRLDPLGDGGIEALGVEYDIGYASQGRENRRYRGVVIVTVDAGGKTAAMNVLPLEELLMGIVPGEIFASAPEEALKAQAVAARGEVLAKIGSRHLADPYLLCAEQHCQVYKGMGAEHGRTSRAVDQTRGEVLMGGRGELVDTVYSSTCGGHTENNEAVWGTPPNPHLRGTPDLLDPEMDLPSGAENPRLLSLTNTSEMMCGASSFSRPDKVRWVRHFTADELNRAVAHLGVGEVERMEVPGRGVSGRATGLRFIGSEGEALVDGELRVRRLLGNLNSSLFVVEKVQGGWRFTGAGWGHGVGMCQMGAIGRAERGEGHDAILRHYYRGARKVRLY